MLNRSQTNILDLLASFIANPVSETYGQFTRYLNEYYAETNMIVWQCLAEKRSVDLSLEVRGLLEAALMLYEGSGTNAGKKIVAPLCKLALQFPENELLMSVLALCFRKGAAFSDLLDTMDCKRLFPAEAESWNSQRLCFYCLDKSWMMSKKFNWSQMAWFLRKGISAELFWKSHSQSYFPAEARSWKAIQLAAYCSAKALVINPQDADCWHDLAVDFSLGVMLANLPVDFVLMIFSCIKNDAPVNYYCAVFCLEKALMFVPDSKKQTILDNYEKTKNELQREIASSVMKKNDHQAQQTLAALSAQAKLNTAFAQLSELVNNFLLHSDVRAYNELLRGLLPRRRNSDYLNYADNRNLIEQKVNEMPQCLETILVKAALMLQAPETETGTLAEDFHKLVLEYPKMPLLNYCLGASYYKSGMGKDWIFLAIFYLSKEVKISPENDEAWKMLASLIEKNLLQPFADKGIFNQEISTFDLLIPWNCESKWKWNASEAYCLAKSYAIHPDAKVKTRLGSLLITIHDQGIRQIIQNSMYSQQASNTLTKPSPPTLNKFHKSDNVGQGKRKFDEGLSVSNKIAKVNINESPSLRRFR